MQDIVVFTSINQDKCFHKIHDLKLILEKQLFFDVTLQPYNKDSSNDFIQQIKNASKKCHAIVFLLDDVQDELYFFNLGFCAGFSVFEKKPILFVCMDNKKHSLCSQNGWLIGLNDLAQRDVIDALTHYLNNDMKNFWISYSKYIIPKINDKFKISLVRLSDLEISLGMKHYHPCDWPTKHFDISVAKRLAKNFDDFSDYIIDKTELNSYLQKPKPNDTMKTINIFLASSRELQQERDEFDLYFRQQNDELLARGVYLKIIRWENFLDAMSQTRLQDEYNKKVCACDIFVSLFFTKTGNFTEEEFSVAHQQFLNTGKPFIYTFFKNADIKTGSAQKQDLMSLWTFQEKLSNLGHFYTSYDNIEHLKLQFKDQMEKMLLEHFLQGIESHKIPSCNKAQSLKKIFISYSKHDNNHKDTLIKHLAGLKNDMVSWNDRDLLGGEDWDERIKQELQQADIVLYLVTANSMNTDYIQNVELPMIEQRCKDGECTLVPVIVDFCHWERLNFAKNTALPEKGTPVTDTNHWVNQNQAWLAVVKGIEQLLN